MKSPKMATLLKSLFTVLASAAILATPSAQAASATWVGNTSVNWNTAANWSGGTVPVNGDTLIFGQAGSSGLSLVDNVSGRTWGSNGTDGIVFTTSANSYSISGSSNFVTTLNSS